MFGKNKISKPYEDRSGDLMVNELFYTIQGEGPDAGRPAIFLRLTGCNLRCYFCDTEFEKGQHFTLENVFNEILNQALRNPCRLVVITGGEPLLQNVVPLIKKLNDRGIAVSIETAGTVCYDELFEVFSPTGAISGNLIVCSPKTPKIHKDVERLVAAYKYIIKNGVSVNGFPCTSTQVEDKLGNIFVPSDGAVPIYLQAMDEQDPTLNKENLEYAAKLCMAHGHRLSVQMHKLAGLR